MPAERISYVRFSCGTCGYHNCTDISIEENTRVDIASRLWTQCIPSIISVYLISHSSSLLLLSLNAGPAVSTRIGIVLIFSLKHCHTRTLFEM
jgi:hypothetical protein